MINASTLGYMIDNGDRLSIHCENQWCDQRAIKPVDLESLALRIGREHSTLSVDLQRYFYCRACDAAGRAKRIGFILHSNTNRGVEGPITETVEKYRNG